MKKVLIILIVIFSTLNSYAQIVNIPDINFKNALIEDGIDINNDGEIQVSEAEVVLNLNVSYEDISSLEGIQSFINIELLICTHNQLSSIDVSQNLNLRNLWCGNNQLSILDVSQNLNLDSLWCSFNQLSDLDLSQNLNLKSLVCRNNQLSSLDITQNENIEQLTCDNNQLISLYINNENNHNMYDMLSQGNINLTCIQIDDENATYPECMEFPVEGWCIDEWSSYSEDYSFGVNDVFATQITLYPNPVQNVLRIDNSRSYKIIAIRVHDMQGRMVLQKINPSNLLDVSGLTCGLFFVQLETDRGVFTQKIIKQ